MGLKYGEAYNGSRLPKGNGIMFLKRENQGSEDSRNGAYITYVSTLGIETDAENRRLSNIKLMFQKREGQGSEDSRNGSVYPIREYRRIETDAEILCLSNIKKPFPFNG
jgi:hypothetical protein